MAVISFDPNSSLLQPQSQTNCVGDAFLAPLKWCGDKWQTLNASESSEGLNKIFTCAYKIILGPLLFLATALAFVPGSIGSLIKSCTETPIERIEQWNVAMDAPLKERCRQLGINDPNVRPANIEDRFCMNLVLENGLDIGGLVSARRETQPLPSKHIEIKNLIGSSAFINNLVNCFPAAENRLSPQEQSNAVNKLIAIVLGDRRAPLTEKDISDLRIKIAPVNKIELSISENLEQMKLRLFSRV